MPLTSPEDFDRLGEHLTALDPLLDEFCGRSGFVRQTVVMSRYPMRRLTFDGRVHWWIELRMELNERGEHYDEFFPKIPYWLGGGGWVESQGYRHTGGRVDTLKRIPFSDLPAKLPAGLAETWNRIKHYDKKFLVDLGLRVRLGAVKYR